MDILLAEDDPPSRLMLQSLLVKWGYSVIAATDGAEAWSILCQKEHPQLLLLDWMMPGMDGPEIIRRLRKREPDDLYYAIIITSNNQKDSVTQALNSGADDFIHKPFDHHELQARVAVGARMNALQTALSQHLKKLEATLAQVKHLEGIIPICMYCKKIRDDRNSWNQLETYISEHSEALFSHGICPDCFDRKIKSA